MDQVLGIDIGGTGIKGAPVDVGKGALTAERHRILTPDPATPAAVTKVFVELVRHFDWSGSIGATFPGVVRHGTIGSAANLDKGWVGLDAATNFSAATGCAVSLVNDADAAGVAELRFGQGQGRGGVVMMLTLGTGIGSALFVDGILVPNTELGHLQMRGKDAEHWASEAARERRQLSWKEWAEDLDEYLHVLEGLFSPELFIIGGGASKKSEKFLPHLTISTEIVPATLLNEAGIIGAAVIAT